MFIAILWLNTYGHAGDGFDPGAGGAGDGDGDGDGHMLETVVMAELKYKALVINVVFDVYILDTALKKQNYNHKYFELADKL